MPLDVRNVNTTPVSFRNAISADGFNASQTVRMAPFDGEDIASASDAHVSLSATESLWPVSKNKLMAHAALQNDLPAYAERILELCTGLPIALAVPGQCIAVFCEIVRDSMNE